MSLKDVRSCLTRAAQGDYIASLQQRIQELEDERQTKVNAELIGPSKDPESTACMLMLSCLAGVKITVDGAKFEITVPIPNESGTYP